MFLFNLTLLILLRDYNISLALGPKKTVGYAPVFAKAALDAQMGPIDSLDLKAGGSSDSGGEIMFGVSIRISLMKSLN